MSGTPAEPGPGAALVTGASRRIGRAIAIELGRAGWRVCVHYHASEDAALETVEEIRQAGGTAAAVQADLSDEGETAGLLGAAAATVGPFTLLVNNASVFEKDDLFDVTRASWDRHMEVNLRAPLVLTQAFAAQLPDGRDGNVINLLDQRVWKLTPYFLSYTLTKAALWTLTRTSAQALAPRIRVNGVGPGPALPNPRQSAAHFAAQAKAVPLGRPTNPEEIARAVMFILDMPSMTGQMIALDGGQHIAWQTPDIIGVEE